MSSDPWRYRSEGMKCKTCMWFIVKEQVKGKHKTDSKTVWFGRCRRHAPTINGYPACFGTDWCGDHKLNENAI